MRPVAIFAAMFDGWEIAVVAGVGLIAGVLGGMLGVGGSVIMIPAMVALFGQNLRDGFNQHLYQAAAMLVNVAVVAPAAVRHYKAGAIVPRALVRIVPAAAVLILVGVWVSDRFDGRVGAVWLGRLLGVFLVYVVYVNIRRLISGRREVLGEATIDLRRGSAVGGVMGFMAGLLGIGGGAIAVPLQQTLLRLPLRNCIANSTAIICLTAGIGAVYKNITLSDHGLAWQTSLTLAGLLAPTAVIGGYLGGRLTHVLPLKTVRIAFIVLMVLAAWRMLAIGERWGFG